jgi:hypothetical protein
MNCEKKKIHCKTVISTNKKLLGDNALPTEDKNLLTFFFMMMTVIKVSDFGYRSLEISSAMKLILKEAVEHILLGYFRLSFKKLTYLSNNQ